MATMGDDLLSERLISQLLENDLLLLESMKEAETLQLDQVLAVSARAQGHIPKLSEAESPIRSETDAELAIRLYLSDARASIDMAFAQSIQNETHIENTTNYQYALKVAAAERKINMDADFARKLQTLDDEGEDVDTFKDTESINDRKSMYVDPNSFKALGDHAGGDIVMEDGTKSKGKERERSSSVIDVQSESEETATSLASYPICGICLEPFKVTHSPINASLSANFSSRLPFGLRLPCPCEHTYCISCLATYILSKLDPEGVGPGKSVAIVFPIRCPECQLSEWSGGMTDDIAERILGEDGMVQWHHQKLLDSIPRLFCPNPKCSSLVEADEDSDDPQAICPSCQETICASCRTLWHTGLTCEEYQALPLDERSPEDRLLLELAKAERWRRCPSCAVIVELVSGCNHMTCRCGFHFCFQCGSPTTTGGICTRKPPCELWEEDMLLEARERRPRNNIIPANVPAPAPAPAVAAGRLPAPPLAPDYPPNGNLEWMFNPHVLCGRHWFTTHMVSNLTCGYCNAPSISLADLRHHLEHVQHHEVYTCCGRFFKRIIDFERHTESTTGRFGGRHAYRSDR